MAIGTITLHGTTPPTSGKSTSTTILVDPYSADVTGTIVFDVPFQHVTGVAGTAVLTYTAGESTSESLTKSLNGNCEGGDIPVYNVTIIDNHGSLNIQFDTQNRLSGIVLDRVSIASNTLNGPEAPYSVTVDDGEDGLVGDYRGAPASSLYVDDAHKIVYTNAGTAACPYWIVIPVQ